MYIEQLYTNCLAEAAYWIESNGEAAVIDPIRETEPYLKKAAERGVKIKYVFETHFHADFVSGHIDLAKATDATIVFGPLAETGYAVHNAADGEEFNIGKLRLRVLHTPGHTPESSSFLLFDENGKEHAVFTGDTLFVGDVGRPDLLDGKMTKEELASMLFDSLSNKLKPLADDVIVYPAHGPGSACGKNIGKETWST
ncbi:MAG: MBL fold metallo-hydrolase, partial [Bacteroidia bacterium]